MSKKMTLQQVAEAAKKMNVAVAALWAVIEVECRGQGFNVDNTPVILFERHVFRQRLIANGKSSVAQRVMRERPDLCSVASGGYGLESAQHGRLAVAAQYDRHSALESASWGIGQVMGYHWKSLGYVSLQAFVNAMYKDEAAQLDAMCRFIVKNGLDRLLRQLDWAGFALRYNGAGYAKNHYDTKLAAAYKKHSL